MTIGAIASGIAIGVGTSILSSALKGGMSGGGGSSGPTPISLPVGQTLQGIQGATASPKVKLKTNTQTAKTAGTNSSDIPSNETDPWANTRDWYTTLGGDPETAKGINSEAMPF